MESLYPVPQRQAPWDEEREVAAEFGEAYVRYAARVPAFFPRPGARGRDPVG